LDADKEGFLRSHRSLTQTVGRAARNVNGKVIFYADIVTESMQKTIDETNRRREIQIQYNADHNITPTQIKKASTSIFAKKSTGSGAEPKPYIQTDPIAIAAEKGAEYKSRSEIEKAIEQTKKKMKEAAKNLEFLEAAQYRDHLIRLEGLLGKK